MVWGGVRNLVLLPYSPPDISSLMAISPEHWFLAHIVFGATLGLSPKLARLIHRVENQKIDEIEIKAAA